MSLRERPPKLLPLLVAVLGTMAPMKRDVHSVRERMEGLSLGFCTPAPWPINPKSLADRPALVRWPYTCVPCRALSESSAGLLSD